MVFGSMAACLVIRGCIFTTKHKVNANSMNSLAYKPNCDETVSRLRQWHERSSMDRILARCQVPSETMDRFRAEREDGDCEYPDPNERITFWDRILAEKSLVEDDSIPAVYLTEMDQGLYGGMVDAEVRFQCDTQNGWISSMVVPLWDDWSKYDTLKIDPRHPWFKRYLNQLEIFVDGAAGNFGVSHFILIDSLNFVFELLGATGAYMSVETEPEMVRRAVDFAFELNTLVQDAFFDNTPRLLGGTCSNMVSWAPGRIVSESLDPFHMASVDYFEKWGREPVERIMGRYDGGVVHIHGNGRHLLEVATTIRGLKAIYMGDDMGFPSAVDIAGELRKRAGDTPLVIRTKYEDFTGKLDRHELPGGILYEVTNVPSVGEANRLMERVRTYGV